MGLNADVVTDFGEKVGHDVTDFVVTDGGESPSGTHKGSRAVVGVRWPSLAAATMWYYSITQQ